MAAAIASGCLTGSTPADRSEVIRQILPTTVQLRCERDANDRRAASGVVVGRDSGTRRAWVVTTRHFLEPLKAQKVYVKAAGDQARVAATLVKVSDQADLALLEVQGFDAPPARLKETVQIGDEVWVVAYPWGRRMTLSNGVVSQVTHADGDAGYEGSARMVDVSVAYGASGGGVFDAPTGALVGLVESYRTAKMTVKGSPERVVEIPVPGETTLIPAGAIRRLLIEAGLAHLLEP